MAAYVSLYRKWRPQTFSDVVGQAHVVKTLENSLYTGRVSHAYLFIGPRGTGKTTVARLMAKGLNCIQGPTDKPCGHCNQCEGIARGNSLNVIEIDGASNRGIDEIRELREQVRYTPADGRYRVYIIDEVHMLTPEAFNALLKTLEEPPEHVIFILATTDPHKIPATILSRCQRYDFKRFSPEQICARLQTVLSGEGINAQPEALEIVAQHAEGGMRDALGIIDQCIAYAQEITPEVVGEILGVVNKTQLQQFAQAIREKQASMALGIIGQLYSAGKDLGQFNRDIIDYFRSCLLKNEGNWDNAELIYIIEGFSQCEQEMRVVSDQKIPLELTVIRLTEIASQWQQLQGKLQELEQQVAELKKSGVTVSASNGATPNSETTSESGVKLAMDSDDKKRLKQIKDNWEGFLQTLRNERLIQPEAFLREGTPVHLQGEQLTITFPKERGFHKASIEQDKHRQPAERVLAKFFGVALNIYCTTGEPKDYQVALGNQELEEKSLDNQQELDQTVAAALKMFGGKVIKVKDSDS